MPKSDYQPPVANLLRYGVCTFSDDWPNYVRELKLQESHVPELLQMATDTRLNQADSDSLEVWAPTHAWRSLGQLKAEAAARPLLKLLNNPEDDWVHSEIPIVTGMIGSSAIADVQQYMVDPTSDFYGRNSAILCFREIYSHHPEARDQCVDVLVEQLAKYEENDPEFNGFLIAGLCDLNASEKAADIERAFAAKRVDFSIVGDWDEVQVQLGLKTREEVPLRGFTPMSVLGPLSDLMAYGDDPLEPVLFKQSSKKPPSQGFGSKSASKKKGSKKKKK